MKGIGIIGNYRGKLGNTVAYTLKGSNNKETQAFRVYQPSVKNPRSSYQQAQRAKVALTGLAYKALKNITDHSFQGFAAGVQSFNEFRRLTLRAIDNYPTSFAYPNWKQTYTPLGEFPMSSGDLPSFGRPNVLTTDRVQIYDANDGDIGTAGALADRLGIPESGYITICVLPLQNAETGLVPLQWLRMYYPKDRSTIVYTDSDPFNGQPIPQAMYEAFAVQRGPYANSGLAVMEQGGDGLAFNLTSGQEIGAAAVIRSLRDGSRRSTEHLHIATNITLYPSFDEALITWPIGEELILNGGDKGTSLSEVTEVFELPLTAINFTHGVDQSLNAVPFVALDTYRGLAIRKDQAPEVLRNYANSGRTPVYMTYNTDAYMAHIQVDQEYIKLVFDNDYETRLEIATSVVSDTPWRNYADYEVPREANSFSLFFTKVDLTSNNVDSWQPTAEIQQLSDYKIIQISLSPDVVSRIPNGAIAFVSGVASNVGEMTPTRFGGILQGTELTINNTEDNVLTVNDSGSTTPLWSTIDLVIAYVQ